MLHKKAVLVKKRHFYVKKLLFYKLRGCKNTAFLQKYIFALKNGPCKKASFLCKKLLKVVTQTLHSCMHQHGFQHSMNPVIEV